MTFPSPPAPLPAGEGSSRVAGATFTLMRRRWLLVPVLLAWRASRWARPGWTGARAAPAAVCIRASGSPTRCRATGIPTTSTSRCTACRACSRPSSASPATRRSLPASSPTGARAATARRPEARAGGLSRLPRRRPSEAAPAHARGLRPVPRGTEGCLAVGAALRLSEPCAGHGAGHRQQALRGQAEGGNDGLRAVPFGGDQVRFLPHPPPLRPGRSAPAGGLHHLPQRTAPSRRRNLLSPRPTASAIWPMGRNGTGTSLSRKATTPFRPAPTAT